MLPAVKAGASPLPTAFSLADRGWITPVKNQGQLGTCWAFSATTTVESAIVRGGYRSPREAGGYLSEWDLATHHGVQLQLRFPYNNWGGYPGYAPAYFIRGFGNWPVNGVGSPAGGGPVERANTPLNDYPYKAALKGKFLGPYRTPDNQPLAPYRVTRVIMWNYEGPADAPPSEAFRERIKRAILRHGAIVTGMAAYTLNTHLSSINNSFLCTDPNQFIDHDVTVAGWDDTIPVYDKDGHQKGTGAWLIQNSWGTRWAPLTSGGKRPGYFWLGYEDIFAIKQLTTYMVRPRGQISPTVLQNQIFYPTTQIGTEGKSPVWCATQLTAQSTTKLLAIGVWTVTNDTRVDMRIYRAGGANGPQGPAEAVLRDILLPQQGYAEIPLPSPISLGAGNSVFVVIRYANGETKPLALDQQSLQLSNRGNAARVSWWSKDGRRWMPLGGPGVPAAERGIPLVKGIAGGVLTSERAGFVQVRGLTTPPRTAGSSYPLRGIASFNAERVLYQVNDGNVREASGTTTWILTAQGLRLGRNVVRIWADTGAGASASPARVIINRW